MQSFFSFPASSLFGTQQQLTHPPVKSSTLPLRKMTVFHGVAPRHTNFPSSCVILFGTQQQLSHLPVKSSTLPLRKIPVFQGAAPWHTLFTSSCVIPLWDSATAHSPSGRELKLSSLEESCFSGLVVLLMLSDYPAWALFGLVLTHITH